MKKIFTLAAAVLASFSLWAAEPTLAIGTTAQTSSTFLGAYTEQGITLSSSASYSSGAVQLGSTPSSYDQHYFEVLSSSDIIDSISFLISGNGSNKSIQAPVFAWENTATGNTADTYAILDAVTVTANSYDAAKWFTYDLTAVDVKCARIYRTTKGISSINPEYTGSSTALGSGQTIKIYGIKVYTHANCTDPEAHLAFTKSTAYVGEQFSYDYGSKSGGDLSDYYTLNGVPAVKGTDYTFTSGNITVLKAGQFVMRMITGAVGDYCAADLSDTILINEATPVAACAIEGPTTAYIGNAVTFTATAANASDYAWTVNGVDANTNAAEFTYTPAAAGEYSIVCSARNKFNAANEWIASEPIALNVTKLYGELITATLTSGSAATVTGLIGGTADVSLSSSKKMDKGKYFGITLASGNFLEGDTVVITMTTAGSNYPCLFADKERTNCLFLATETSSDLEYKIVLPAAANTLNTLYLARDADDATYKWNPVLASMSVIRPMAAKNVIESLIGVAVDDVAISDLAALLANHEITLADSYVNAPVVKFTKHVVTTYIDDSQAEKDVVVEVTAEEVEGAWEAAATIGGVAYTVKAAKENSVVVTYMDGETKLGEENVAIGGHPADFAQYQNKSLASFVGWYNDADLADEHIVADMSSEVISVATTYYAKFENAYATSYNFEKAVMENGKAYDFLSQLGAQHYATNITGSLDSLDNSKKDSLRNYAYLGLKVKKSGALLNFRVAAGQTIKVKFGNIAKTPTVSINGGDYAEMEITEHVYEHTAATEELISIKTMDANAVVFQQIAIGEELAAPELYTINYAETENGAVSGWKMGIPGEEVKVYYEAAEGLKTVSLTVNGVALHDNDQLGYVTFEMPEEAVTVEAMFDTDFPTAIENSEVEVKAVKVIRDGKLFIEKNGVLYDAQGTVVK